MPSPLTPLVGREREVADLLATLRRSDVRLVTLTGPGGVGKSRLALRAAADLTEEFAGGAAFVGLAAVRDPELVVPAIAQTLGVRRVGAQPPMAALEAALRSQDLLLVLDSFEQVLEAGPRVSELLEACPSLKAIVTSRSVLRVRGEWAVPVGPLAVEELGARSWGLGDGGEGAESALVPSARPLAPAVELFMERTRAVRPDFVLSAANAGAVAAIVQRLDGLPLAIELAAARGTLYSPAALLARLERRLPHLTGGARDLPARHQTMRDAIAWSHDLLTPEEQRVLRCLAAFDGGATLEAIEAVCDAPEAAGPAGDGSDVAATVESLARQSLLAVVEAPGEGFPSGRGGGPPRLVMLETVREFAAEQLARGGEREPGRRHAEYYLALAASVERSYWGEGPGDWRTVLGEEHGNTRAALVWAMEHGETEIALRLACALFDPHWVSETDAHEQGRWVHRVLAMPGGSPEARVLALTWAAWVFPESDLAESRAFAEEAVALARRHGDELGVALGLGSLGHIALHEGDAARARPLLLDALVRFRRLGARGRAGWVLCRLATMDSRDAVDEGGDPAALARALGAYEEALALFRAVGDARAVVRARHGVAYVTYKLRDLPRALALTQEVLAAEWADRWPVYDYLEDIADIAGRTGHPEGAARLYGAAAAQRERDDRPVGPFFRAEFERDQAVSRRALSEAVFAAAWAAGRALPLERAVAEALALTPVSARPPGMTLSPREAEVLSLLAAGRTHRAIGKELFISERTVDSHVARLFRKLGARTRAEAIAAARAVGLIAEAPDTASAPPASSPRSDRADVEPCPPA